MQEGGEVAGRKGRIAGQFCADVAALGDQAGGDDEVDRVVGEDVVVGPLDRVGLLHDGARVVEHRQVAQQVARVDVLGDVLDQLARPWGRNI